MNVLTLYIINLLIWIQNEINNSDSIGAPPEMIDMEDVDLNLDLDEDEEEDDFQP